MTMFEGVRNFVFGRPLPVVTYASSLEQIVRDVKKVKSQTKYNVTMKRFKVRVTEIISNVASRKLTETTIPDYIITVTVVSVLSLIPAFILNISPFVVLVIALGAHIVLVMRYKGIVNDAANY